MNMIKITKRHKHAIVWHSVIYSFQQLQQEALNQSLIGQIIPAATVLLLASSITIKLPVAWLR